ncbi:zinc finger and BTB domain-containing protein 12-like isoform X1 [Brienomyrus brachyistius]|uniref:zinc finger and BTB domain-containing protein 12-like isoform X1 n=1 Tax=Brienomyrus brachyistius TaxID=42636 RepID=UPI0020B422AA|nr:zinc finger and BTB domain-containing protein 12-like isoform X1 [Brienomyrus brachyistius]XP_048850094.1 zinc finger and BTB domain-containing protein 12-like isoform X1 [Brienomyrus brachyistius]XP_048850095.1 zinc finger and BTB domain-containing protein 12-like isoform X1 [Brienomyrus brachyistius]
MELLCFRLPGHGDATLQNMNSLRTRQHFCDITIVASDQQTFRGHKVVLAACSPFLRDQFLLNPSSELQVSVLHSASVVCQLLQSCYTGILQFSTKEIVNYLTAASYLQMENVVEKCRGALSQYLQPRTPSPSGTIKLEENQALPDFESGRHSMRSRSPPAGQSGSMQLSSRRSSQACADAHIQTGSCKDDTLDESVSVLKVKPSGPTEEFHEEEEREDYEVFQVCIEEDEEGDEEKRREEDDDGVVSLDNHFQETVRGKTGDEGEEEIAEHVVGRMEREGYRIWRRRHGEQRGGRARGLRHKRRNTSREMGFSGPHYPDNWHIPTPDEIMGSFGLVHSDFNQGGIKSASVGYISSCDLGQSGTEQLTQVPYGISDVQGESVVEEQGLGDSPAHFRLEESGRGQAMGLTSAREESESVAVVGSTSSSGGPISCDPCGLTFPSAESLTLHARSVHPLFVCPRCGKQFNHASNLNRHMAIHRGTKSHRCHLCHKTFTQKSTLCDHMNLHSGERPHRCSYCHVRFAHKPALRRHLKEQHGKTTAQNCMEAQRERDRERDEGGV